MVAVDRGDEEDADNSTMTRESAQFGDNNNTDAHHRHSHASIFKHRVGPGGDFMVSPIRLIDSEAPTAPQTPGGGPLVKRLTSNSVALQQSLKRELNKRKYAKYNRKYDHGTVPEHAELDTSDAPQQGEGAGAAQTGYMDRIGAKTNKLLKRRRTLGTAMHDQDTAIDILYENQRGIFFFGIPKYSHASLFPKFDPNPWQNAELRASPVDIRNAQVPDPSWEWAWKSWYVDMTRDVDDEGWEYSFEFSGSTGWHGNHPWFHSFVRRRRWLRLRRRKDAARKTKEKAHELTADYFTIHPKTLRPPSEDFSRAASTDLARMEKQLEDEIELEKMDIADIGSLELALKKATVDREKLVAVRKFIKTGGDELYYLSERMPDVMNMLVFQSSRRQLLTDLLAHFDQAHERRESLKDHTHDKQSQQEHDQATRQADNLMNAVQAADELVKKLEYWSDIKGMATGGKTLQDTSEGHWDASKWQGLSSTDEKDKHPIDTFVNKQKASEGTPSLHNHSEHEPASEKENRSGSVFYDAQQTPKDVSEADDYSTAGESASEISKRKKGKGKSRATNATSLDGVTEEEDDNDLTKMFSAHGEDAANPDVPSRTKNRHSVRLVEPAAIVDDNEPTTETLTQDAAAHQNYLRREARERERGGMSS